MQETILDRLARTRIKHAGFGTPRWYRFHLTV